LYDWFIEKLEIFPSKQYEFARLNLTYTVMSKRKLLELVRKGFVNGWDDPRMPTICGLRRRGYTPESIRLFADKVGVAKRDNIIDLSLLEWCVREDLNKRANRYMTVLDPVKLVITNYPDNDVEYFQGALNPGDESAGKRKIPFSKELYIERDDFMEDPPKKYFRLKPGGEVRLKYSYIIKCEEIVKDSDGNIAEIRCTYDPSSKPGAGEWRSVKGTIHWVSVEHAKEVSVNLFDRLFTKPEMDDLEEGKEYIDYLNPDSLKVVTGYAEEALLKDNSAVAVQFERTGYFVKDAKESFEGKTTFNRTVGLKSAW
ncbi:MAG: glutamine--tRNA ligase, partial [Bacteroidia bacterium]|nr:glutamine--tRNA ligase [Bacteroidia bacterium]